MSGCAFLSVDKKHVFDVLRTRTHVSGLKVKRTQASGALRISQHEPLTSPKNEIIPSASFYQGSNHISATSTKRWQVWLTNCSGLTAGKIKWRVFIFCSMLSTKYLHKVGTNETKYMITFHNQSSSVLYSYKRKVPGNTRLDAAYMAYRQAHMRAIS